MTAVAWLAHNCIAHPICGVLWFLGVNRAGDWLHDVTWPRGRETVDTIRAQERP